MAKGATVRASDSATRDWAARTDTLKKMEPARATATTASPAEESPWTRARRRNGALSRDLPRSGTSRRSCWGAERSGEASGSMGAGAITGTMPPDRGTVADRGTEIVRVPRPPYRAWPNPADQRPFRRQPLSRALAPLGSHLSESTAVGAADHGPLPQWGLRGDQAGQARRGPAGPTAKVVPGGRNAPYAAPAAGSCCPASSGALEQPRLRVWQKLRPGPNLPPR